MQSGELVGGRFELAEVAGAGGMGMVFRALDRETGKWVALKVLGSPHEDRDRFSREITHLAAISHPRVVRYITHGMTAADHPYLVMEWVDGESLQALLEHRGLSVAEGVAVVGHVAEALGEIHGHGMVHRDIKPSNLMFEAGDLTRAKLIDFGIARTSSDGKGLTVTGMLVGTPGYMSPEQARGIREIDARADVFSLGCVLYECVTGWTPFAGEHSMALRTKILFSEPLPVAQLCAEVPASLAELIDRMLAKSPDVRPRDGHAVAHALAALPPIPPSRPRRTLGDEVRTVAARGVPRQDFIVLAGYPGELATPPASALAAIVRAIAAIDPEIKVASIEHGAIIVRIAGLAGADGLRERAEMAARCAAACRASLPATPIAIVAVAPDRVIERGAQDAIDRAVEGLFKASLRARGTPVLWADELTRSLVPL